jgi:hypothetical protein
MVAAATGLCLFALLSVYRHQLIPRDADPVRAAWLLTGDEPEYLLMAQAIARGDGLDVGPAYAAGTYLAYQQRPVFRFEDQFRRSYYERRGFRPLWRGAAVWKEGRITQFSPLLPALLAPVVGSTRRIRWAACLLQAALVAACAVAILMHAGVHSPASGTVHAAAALAFGLGGIPAGYYASQIFPEIIAGLLLLLFLFLFTAASPAVRSLSLLCLLASLWATPRVVGGVAAATAALLWRQRAGPRWAEVALLGAGWLAYAIFNTAVWGNPLPPQGTAVLGFAWSEVRALPAPLLVSAAAAAIWLVWIAARKLKRFRHGRLVLLAAAGFGVALLISPGRRILANTAAFFFSNNVGLLVLNPFFVVAAAAGLALREEDERREFPVWLALLAGLLLSVAVFDESRAGSCASGRYQVITACAMLFAPVRILAGRGLRPPPEWLPGMYLLGALSLAASLAVATQPNFWFRKYHPLFGFAPLQDFYPLLPDPGRWTFLPHAVLWLSALLALLLLPARLWRPWRQN